MGGSDIVTGRSKQKQTELDVLTHRGQHWVR
jgi:hypothetical protein